MYWQPVDKKLGRLGVEEAAKKQSRGGKALRKAKKRVCLLDTCVGMFTDNPAFRPLSSISKSEYSSEARRSQ